MKKKKRRPIDEPAGYGRNEEMSRVKDALQQEAEERAEGEEKMTLDPAKLRPDRDILQLFDIETKEIEISLRDPNYEYALARCMPGDERQVQQKLALSVRTSRGSMPCWDVVKGDMLEGSERKTAEGTRRYGDCILMRCRKDVYLLLAEKDQEKRIAQQGSVTSEIEAFAHEQKRNIILHSDPNDPVLQRAMNVGFANEMAQKRVTDHLRHGTMPGASIEELRR